MHGKGKLKVGDRFGTIKEVASLEQEIDKTHEPKGKIKVPLSDFKRRTLFSLCRSELATICIFLRIFQYLKFSQEFIILN